MVFNFSQTPISRVSECLDKVHHFYTKATKTNDTLPEGIYAIYMHLLEDHKFVEASIEECIDVLSDYIY